MESSHCPFQCSASSRKLWIAIFMVFVWSIILLFLLAWYQFLSIWPNRKRVYCSSWCSIHRNFDWYCIHWTTFLISRPYCFDCATSIIATVFYADQTYCIFKIRYWELSRIAKLHYWKRSNFWKPRIIFLHIGTRLSRLIFNKPRNFGAKKDLTNPTALQISSC